METTAERTGRKPTTCAKNTGQGAWRKPWIAVLALPALCWTGPGFAQTNAPVLADMTGTFVVEIAADRPLNGTVVAPGRVATPCHRLATLAQPYQVRIGQAAEEARLLAADEERNVCILQTRDRGTRVLALGTSRRNATVGVNHHIVHREKDYTHTSGWPVGYSAHVVGGIYKGLLPSALASHTYLAADGAPVLDEQQRLTGMVVVGDRGGSPVIMVAPVEWLTHVLEHELAPPPHLSGQAWMNQARVLDAYGDRPGLLANNMAWTTAFRRSAWAWNNLGNAYVSSTEADRLVRAAQAYQLALDIDPQLAPAWNNLGNIYAETRRSSLAIEAYRASTKADPTYSIAWRNLGDLYRKTGQRDRALEALQAAARSGLGPERALALNELAAIHGKGPEAIKALQEAVMAHPGFLLGWMNLGAAWEYAGDQSRAVNAYETALRIDPRNARTWARVGDVYTRLQKDAAALQAYRSATALDPGHGAAWKWIGVHLFKRQEHRAAIEAFSEALKNGESNAFVYSELGQAYKADGQIDRAAQSYTKAGELEPLNALHRLRLSALYREDGRAEEALHQAQEAVRIDPKNACAQDNLGIHLQKSGQLDKAIDAHRQAVLLDPGLGPAWVNLGMALTARQELTDAQSALQQALIIDPHSNAAAINLAVVHIRRSSPQQAIRILEPFLKTQTDPLVLANLGVAYARTQQYEKAFNMHARLERLNPQLANQVFEAELKGVPGYEKSRAEMSGS